MIKSDFYIDFLINSTNFMINSVYFSEIRPDHPIKFQQSPKKKQPRFLTLVTPACHGLSPSPPGQSATHSKSKTRYYQQNNELNSSKRREKIKENITQNPHFTHPLPPTPANCNTASPRARR
jgi:hypothetical protein